ncbi:hypothetical protein Z965_06470 [Clostridium novyi A str. BKT29909]|nr:hypothetical protein Z965_06470 [Clostridium novyi A str. BKT29909]
MKLTILERLKLELSNKDYFTDNEYKVFLEENLLNPTDNYNKKLHQRNLLYTCIDILEAVSNDVDMMRKVSDGTTEFTTDSAYKFIQDRIQKIKEKIATIPTGEEVVKNDSFCLMFSKRR